MLQLQRGLYVSHKCPRLYMLTVDGDDLENFPQLDSSLSIVTHGESSIDMTIYLQVIIGLASHRTLHL